MIDLINQIIDEQVKPKLSAHNGDIEVISYEDGVLKVRFKGQCEGCPSAKFTLEEVVSSVIKENVPQVKSVECIDGISEDAYLLAKKILGINR